MEKFNGAFKTLAEKMHLPTFFRGNTLILNNLFLLILTVVLLIALLLVIFLMPGKKKKKAKSAKKASAPVEKTEEEVAPAEQETPVKETPAEQETPAEEPVQAAEKPAQEPQKEEPVAVTPVEAPAEKPAQESEAVPAEQEAEELPAEQETETVASPQEETVAEDARPGKNGGKYEIVKKNGSFYFLLKANNGQLLLESSGYTTEQGAKKAIDTFKNAVEKGEFNVDEDKNGNYKFVLRASARSQMLYYGESYGTRQSAENAIGSVKNFAFRAVIRRAEDLDVEEGGDVSAVVETKPLAESDHKQGGKYEIVERDGSFFFLLKANNGQLLLESPAYTTEQGAKSGIESFKKAADGGIYTIDKDKNGNFRFILRASARTQLRYYGESYGTRQSAENSVNSVRAFAQKAVLK